MKTTTPTRVGLPVAALAALISLSACSGSDSSDHSSGGSRAAYSADSPEADATAGAVSEAGRDQTSPNDRNISNKAEIEGPAIISVGTVSMESDDVSKARFDVRKVVDEYRGSVTEDETTTAEGEMDTARLVIRVPSEAFTKAKADLEKIGTSTGSTTNSDDVSVEVVDVESRIRSQRKSVARIEALLARAQNLTDIVSIESQLSTRQADLEALLARQKYLADQTSQSTITVHIERPTEQTKKDTDTDETDGFIGGLKQGWDSFVSALIGALTVLGFLLPWLALIGVLLFPVWALVRRRPRPATVAASPNPQP